MSVLATQRTISVYEYENTFDEIYYMITDKLSRISKRKSKWTNAAIYKTLNDASENIMHIQELYRIDKCRNDVRAENAIKAIRKIYQLKKPLLILWIVEDIEYKKIKRWCDCLNKELQLLAEIVDNEEFEIDKFQIFERNKIREVQFLENMYVFTRKVHSHVIRLNRKYVDTYACKLLRLVNNCMYDLWQGNLIYPTNRKMYLKRRNLFSEAIAYLKEAQRPITHLMLMKVFDEQTIENWSEIIEEELKLIHAINKSDKERFGKL